MLKLSTVRFKSSKKADDIPDYKIFHLEFLPFGTFVRKKKGNYTYLLQQQTFISVQKMYLYSEHKGSVGYVVIPFQCRKHYFLF